MLHMQKATAVCNLTEQVLYVTVCEDGELEDSEE